jgi:filamentous hemagglutinin family protein
MAVLLGITAAMNSAYAMPTGEEVRSGDATFDRVDNILTINQVTDKVAIDWSSFNISKGELVKFTQNGGIALNRILDSNATQIFGRLQSDGTVVVVNPNGTIFGDGCQINTGTFITSTANLSDQFMNDFRKI